MKRMYTCFLCTSNVIYVIAVDSVCAINLPGNVISSRIGCSSFSLSNRGGSQSQQGWAKYCLPTQFWKSWKYVFSWFFSSPFPPTDVYFHMFQVLLRQIVVNLTENAIRKPPQTVPSLPYLQWNMFLFSKVEKVRQNEEKLKHHCAKFTFSPLIVFIFFVISHCSFFTSWNQDLLTHLKDINCGMSSDPRRSTSLPYQRTIYGFVPNPILPFLPGISRHNWHDRPDTV